MYLRDGTLSVKLCPCLIVWKFCLMFVRGLLRPLQPQHLVAVPPTRTQRRQSGVDEFCWLLRRITLPLEPFHVLFSAQNRALCRLCKQAEAAPACARRPGRSRRALAQPGTELRSSPTCCKRRRPHWGRVPNSPVTSSQAGYLLGTQSHCTSDPLATKPGFAPPPSHPPWPVQ